MASTPAEKKGVSLAPKKLSDFLATEFPEPTWVVDQLMPAGVGIIAGAPKARKTWLAIDVGLSVASGRDVLGVTVEQGPVLYAALEGLPRNHQDRIKQVLGNTKPPDEFHIIGDLPRMGQGLEQALGDWITSTEARLVIIDTLVRVAGERRPGLPQYEQDAAILRSLEVLTRTKHQETSIALVHHSREAAAADPLDTIGLSRGLTGTAEWAWVLASNPQVRTDAVLHSIGRQAEPQSLALSWDGAIKRWKCAGAALDFVGGELRGRVLSALRNSEEGLTPSELAEELNLNPATARSTIKRMKSAGQITSEGGRYKPSRTTDEPANGYF